MLITLILLQEGCENEHSISLSTYNPTTKIQQRETESSDDR